MPEENALSPREREILQLAATGLTNREIAQKLTISPNTVKVHLSNIFEKTGVSSRTEATLYGMEHGIVEVPGGGEAGAGQTTWRDLARKYLWVGAALLLLLAVFLVTFSTNVLFPAPTPEPAALAERWKELAPMPEPRARMAAAAYDGEIYAIAGEGPQGVSGDVFRYTPATDTWAVLSDKPTQVADVQGVLIGEKIYVPGGRLASGMPTDVLEIYDPRQDAWETGAKLPKAVSAYALADFEGQLYLLGGWDGERALDSVYVYDPAGDAWREGTPMAVARQDAGAVALADKIVVLGGRNDRGALKEARAYFPSRDASNEVPWETFADLPESRYGFGAASIYDKIYVIGGTSENEGRDKTLIAFQFNGDSWDSLTIDVVEYLIETTLLPLGSQIYIISPTTMGIETSLWRYQAYFFEIFIPIVK